MMADQDEYEDVNDKMYGPSEERTKEIYEMIQSVESRMEKLGIETCAREFMQRFPEVVPSEFYIDGNDKELFKALRDARCFYLVANNKATNWVTSDKIMTGDYSGQVESIESRIDFIENRMQEAFNEDEGEKLADEKVALKKLRKNKVALIDKWMRDFHTILTTLYNKKSQDISTTSNTDRETNASTVANKTDHDSSTSLLCMGANGTTDDLSAIESNLDDKHDFDTDFETSGFIDEASESLNGGVFTILSADDNKKEEVGISEEEDDVMMFLCLKYKDANAQWTNELSLVSLSQRDQVFKKDALKKVMPCESFIYLVMSDPKKMDISTYKV
jgi:hypothetical protein